MGNRQYDRCVETVRSSLVKDRSRKLPEYTKNIFDDMYRQLEEENQAAIVARMEDLADTVKVAFRITEYFALVFITYVVANIVLLGLNLNYYVTCAGILLMGAAFIFKLIEFVANKYGSLMDTYLFMIYKEVLEKKAKEMV